MPYIEGDATDLTWSFTDRSTGAPADPSSLILKVRSPRSGIRTYTYGVDQELVRDGVGSFSFHLDLNAGGFWRWRIESKGVAQRAMQRGIYVRPAAV
jgi:hypothetical protein